MSIILGIVVLYYLLGLSAFITGIITEYKDLIDMVNVEEIQGQNGRLNAWITVLTPLAYTIIIGWPILLWIEMTKARRSRE